MKEKLKKFFSILLVEFTDLEDELQMLIDSTEERFKRHEITGYVWTENTALLKRELTLIRLIHKKIAELDPVEYANIEEAKRAVLETVNNQHSVPQAVPQFIEKRLEKVVRYLEEC
ncbi:MAG: hypothetical protein ACLFQW_09745 [Spirochaetaceae bacterium]